MGVRHAVLNGLTHSGRHYLFTDDGKQKITFITRPLTKMGEIFKSGDSTELNIPYDDTLLLPDKNDSKYNDMKQEVINKGLMRQSIALEWIKKCELCDDSEKCKIEKCIGDMCFFNHYVLDLFSPRWGYTGKNMNRLIDNFKGGNKGGNKGKKTKGKKSRKNHRKSIRRRR
jgi:hypothetical protein